mmetsp:Transcript_16876/g.20310  ORF Transcript_16876/g.20310 Transcript_16876/m.20310 type:complete len:214 (-) Transcript_16876:173-814(-)
MVLFRSKASWQTEQCSTSPFSSTRTAGSNLTSSILDTITRGSSAKVNVLLFCTQEIKFLDASIAMELIARTTVCKLTHHFTAVYNSDAVSWHVSEETTQYIPMATQACTALKYMESTSLTRKGGAPSCGDHLRSILWNNSFFQTPNSHSTTQTFTYSANGTSHSSFSCFANSMRTHPNATKLTVHSTASRTRSIRAAALWWIRFLADRPAKRC